MVLNYIWIGFFIVAFLVALGETIFHGNIGVWSRIMNASFDSAATAFQISIGLTGILTLWMGIMKIGEEGGVIKFMSKLISPLFCRLFPGIPKGHPASGAIFMNISANMLGLDNAATPLGLKAMQDLQSLNKKKDTATDSMLMFLVLNASGLCLIPIGVMMYRAQCGASNPTDVFIPILLATFVATVVGVVALCIKQKIKILDPVILAYLGSLSAIIGIIVWFLSSLPQDKVTEYSTFAANLILFSVITAFIVAGAVKRINVYDAFITGAKDGFKTAVMVIPYLVAILVAIGMFRASGAMDVFTDSVTSLIAWMGFDTGWVGALPTILMKPLSGSGSRAMMVDAMQNFGPDSFVALVSSCIQGSTDTTFYILAVYFGSVGVSKTRYAVPFALFADVIGSIAAVTMAYFFFS